MSARPKVLFILNSLAGGGAERVMLTLLSASADLQNTYDISLVLLDDEPRSYEPPSWLTVHQLDTGRSLAKSFTSLCGLAAKIRPDVTISFLTRSNLVSVLVSMVFRHRSVISERAYTSGHFKPGLAGRVSKGLIRSIYPHATRVIAVSQGISDDLVANFAVRPERITVISNPLDGAAITSAISSGPTPTLRKPFLVAVSRLTHTKNVALIVEALAKSGSDLDLYILGQGPEEQNIRQTAVKFSVHDRVHLLGFQANPFAIMQHAKGFVSASNGEGFPNSLVESLFLGVPVIATNCATGPSEILAQKRREEVQNSLTTSAGILVPPNDVAAFAQAIKSLEDAELCARLSQGGRLRAADFSLQSAKSNYWAAISGALA